MAWARCFDVPRLLERLDTDRYLARDRPAPIVTALQLPDFRADAAMIRLTARGPAVVRDDEWATQQREFARRHCIVFRGFVDGSILERVPRMLETSRYVTREDANKRGVFARELAMDASEPLACMFFFLLNQPRLFEAMAEFTGCGTPIRYFRGRFFKLLPGGEHFDSWHTDSNRARKKLYGLSINLSREPFDGGSFRIRNRKTGEVLREVTTSRFGDAHLFRIHDSLEHMVSAVRGEAPRCCYAGWFSRDLDYREVLREAASPM